MAARKTIGTIDKPWDDSVRAKIQTSMLVNRLTDHVNSSEDLLTSSQVNAAKILLAKTLPDLTSVTLGPNPESGAFSFAIVYEKPRE